MPNWAGTMQQTFEYCEVDPFTWEDKRRLTEIISSSINRDNSNETLATASIESTKEYGEMYIRIYLKTVQNGISERFSLGTFLVQTPHDTHNGKYRSYSYDAYSPLLELKDVRPEIGYFIPKDSNVMDTAYRVMIDNMRSPVVAAESEIELAEDFVAETNETWLSYVKALIANAKYGLGLDDVSRILFMPKIDASAMQPMWTYTDDNSSILYPELTKDRDLYGIPNVVQVVYSSPSGTPMYAEITNDDPNSETSTVSRGRRIIYRETSPSINGQPTQVEIDEYAKQLLKSLSTLEFSITYTHGYCPVNVGDCVMLNYEKAGLIMTKAKVVSQSITCRPGCPVEETAVYTVRMWEG